MNKDWPDNFGWYLSSARHLEFFQVQWYAIQVQTSNETELSKFKLKQVISTFAQRIKYYMFLFYMSKVFVFFWNFTIYYSFSEPEK